MCLRDKKNYIAECKVINFMQTAILHINFLKIHCFSLSQVLGAELAILDEIDSGLDVDALRDVAKAVNELRTSNNSILMITHYLRLLEFIKPTYIHIMVRMSLQQK